MKPVITNVFCLLGKPGSGRQSLLRTVLNDEEFVKKFDIKKLVYGTTRPIKPGDIEGESFHFFTMEEYDNIEPDEFIESRSYDVLYTNEVHYYFTLKRYIKHGDNYIGKVSTFQYEELKKWALVSQLKNSSVRINIYPVLINAPIFEREKRMMRKASTEADIYNMCSKIITEKYEFKMVVEQNPEVIDRSNADTCVLDNSKSGKENVLLLGETLKSFIGNKILLQRL